MNKLSFLLSGLLLFICSCKDSAPFFAEKFYILKVKNTTPASIYYYTDIGEEFQYPDTTLPTKKTPMFKVKLNDSFSLPSPKKWEDLINNMPADTMCMYIFDAETYENTDWNTIRANYMVLKRYSISAEYLNNNNNTIVYP